jgi:hypothetical protein
MGVKVIRKHRFNKAGHIKNPCVLLKDKISNHASKKCFNPFILYRSTYFV